MAEAGDVSRSAKKAVVTGNPGSSTRRACAPLCHYYNRESYLFLSCSSRHFLSHDASLFLSSPDEPPLCPAPASLSNDLALLVIMALYSPGPYSRNSPRDRDGGLTRGGVGLSHATSLPRAATATVAAAAAVGFVSNPAPTLPLLSESEVAIDVAVVVFLVARS